MQSAIKGLIQRVQELMKQAPESVLKCSTDSTEELKSGGMPGDQVESGQGQESRDHEAYRR